MGATSAHRFAAPLTRSLGAIFMQHNVAPETGYDFEPNRILRITPEFLERMIGLVIELSFDPIAFDDVPARLTAGEDDERFGVFTFDDGYRDN